MRFAAPAPAAAPAGLGGGGFGAHAASADKPISVEEFARLNQKTPGDLAKNRGAYADRELEQRAGDDKSEQGRADGAARAEAKEKKVAYDQARDYLARRDQEAVQAGKLGVDLSLQTANLRNQSRLDPTALRNVYGRNCMEIGGVWIDEGFDAKMPTLTIKAQSDAYFKLLDLHPKIKDVLTLGNHLVWVTPNGTALIIDAGTGKETLGKEEIEALFVAKK